MGTALPGVLKQRAGIRLRGSLPDDHNRLQHAYDAVWVHSGKNGKHRNSHRGQHSGHLPNGLAKAREG